MLERSDVHAMSLPPPEPEWMLGRAKYFIRLKINTEVLEID